MDKLTNLIQEAKPLYRQRKRRKAIARLTMLLVVPAIVASNIYNICVCGNDIYLSLHDGTLQQELMKDEFGLSGQ